MNDQKSRASQFQPKVLATDLDGTLIPTHDSHTTSLETLRSKLHDTKTPLVFVTGRDFGLTRDALQQHNLPLPAWIICDVGSTVMKRTESDRFIQEEKYRQHLGELISSLPLSSLKTELAAWQGLELQEDSKQGEFKLSFYALADKVEELVAQLQDWLEKQSAPWSIIGSVDPFTNDGLIDLLPSNVSKAYALEWWQRCEQIEREEIIFAGDSGNDLAALTAGYLAIVVGNTSANVKRRVEDAHQQAPWNDRLYLAEGESTSGVLEGCNFYGLF